MSELPAVRAANVGEGLSSARCCDTSSSPQAPMLYLMFHVQVLYGFLGGVCLPIAAVACEVAVELFVTLRRGF